MNDIEKSSTWGEKQIAEQAEMAGTYQVCEESKYLTDYASMFLYEMSNVYGNKVKTDKDLPFSFYFSRKDDNKHGIRVKIVWNPKKMSQSEDGYMYLHSDWRFVPSPKSKHIDSKLIDRARTFFKKYKVLFAAVWLDMLEAGDVEDFFKGLLSFDELISGGWYLPKKHLAIIKTTKNMEELETAVRKNQMFNMFD